MVRLPFGIVLSFLLLCEMGISAQAQGTRNTGFGSTGFGTNSFGSTGFGGGGFGAGGFGSTGSAFGAGGFGGGRSAFGGGMQSGFGSNLFGGTNLGTFGAGTGYGGTQGNQYFIGRDASDMSRLFNQVQQSSNQFFQRLENTMSRGRDRGANQTQEQRSPVQVQLRVGFDSPRLRPTAVATTIASRLEEVLEQQMVENTSVEVVGRTATLRGSVSSDESRRLIERIVALEPGISRVENQLTIAQPPADSDAPSAAEPE